MNARDVIKKEYGSGRNFMTPHVIDTFWLVPDLFVVELSDGTGFRNDRIVGVTVVSVDDEGNTKRERELSKCFHSPNADMKAGSYVDELMESLSLEDDNA